MENKNELEELKEMAHKLFGEIKVAPLTFEQFASGRIDMIEKYPFYRDVTYLLKSYANGTDKRKKRSAEKILQLAKLKGTFKKNSSYAVYIVFNNKTEEAKFSFAESLNQLPTLMEREVWFNKIYKEMDEMGWGKEVEELKIKTLFLKEEQYFSLQQLEHRISLGNLIYQNEMAIEIGQLFSDRIEQINEVMEINNEKMRKKWEKETAE